MLLNFNISRLYAATDTANDLAMSTTENHERQRRCKINRTQSSALTCERKATRIPAIAEDLNIHHHYHTGWLWRDVLLKYSQELYTNPTKSPNNFDASLFAAVNAALKRCAYTRICENQVLGYFGISNNFASKIHYFFTTNENSGSLNKSLAMALGDSMYYSDSGALINRYTDIKVCEQLKTEAGQDQCHLP